MKAGEVHLANFPFGDVPGTKLRPVFVLTGSLGQVPEVLVAYISSVVPAVLLPTDIAIDPLTPEGSGTKLKVVSVLRLHKLATIHQSNLIRFLGSASPSLRSDVADRLRNMLGL